MSAPLHHCVSCGAPFARVRVAQRTCSPACKKALFRAEKRDAGYIAPSEGLNAADQAPDARETGQYVRLYPGNKPLSDIECRVMKVEPTGLRDKRGALLYRGIEA